ncbi:MAG: hypothetical protein ACTSXD_05155 [Candidatus Heimdallarchaeaceae archaeon]
MEKKKCWFARHLVLTTIISLLVIIFSLCIIFSGGDSNGSSYSKSVSIGEKGKLYQEGYSTVIVCKTKDYMNELIDAVVAKDEVGYKNIIHSHKCYVASTLDDYGDVLVLDRTVGLTKFRFIHPTALHYGEVAWTYSEYVIPK